MKIGSVKRQAEDVAVTPNRDAGTMRCLSLDLGVGKEVLQPIKDPTGQSRHVDDYMGRASNLFGQMRRSLDRCKTRQDIENLFGV